MLSQHPSALAGLFYLAYMTDQRNNSRLKLCHETEAETWLEEYNSDLFGSYIKFKLKDDELYPKVVFSEQMQNLTTRKWWKFLKSRAENSGNDSQLKFATFMMNLHSCPASSASLESWFSTFGLVWDDQRSRLGHMKAFMLAKIYRKLRNM